MNGIDLIQRVIVGGAVFVVAPSILSSCTKDSSTNPGGNPKPARIILDLTLPTNAALNNNGGSLVTQDVIIINTGDGSYSAFTSICSHQGCTVGYNSGAGNIQCPCHDSVYSTSGSVINGPAPRALKAYQLSLTGTILTITL